MLSGWNGILPQETVFKPLFRAEIAFARAHVTMGQLVPCLRKGLGERVEIVQEFFADLAIFGVCLECDVAGHHPQRVYFAGDVCVRCLGRTWVGRCPLPVSYTHLTL